MFVFFFKQKTAYEMRISDWSSDVCSSDLAFDIKIPVDVVVRRLAECNLAATLGGDATLGAECAVAEAECAGARHEDRLILGRSTASADSDIPVSERECRTARKVDRAVDVDVACAHCHDRAPTDSDLPEIVTPSADGKGRAATYLGFTHDSKGSISKGQIGRANV